MENIRRTRVAALTALAASTMFALSAPAATAAASIPRVMDAKASTQALGVTLRLPSVTELRDALVAAGAPVGALPALDIPNNADLSLIVSSTNALANKSDDLIHAEGEAVPLIGEDTAPRASTSCSEASCDSRQSIVEQSVTLPAPANLGRIDIAGATSQTTTYFSTNQRAGLVEVDLSLRNLLDEGKPLAALGAGLKAVTDAINASVLPPVNGAIDTLKTTLDGVAVLQPLKKEVDRVITVDHVRPLPDLSKTDLIKTTVLSGHSRIADEVTSGVTGLRARATTELIDLKVLGGWVSADSIKVLAEAYTNSEKGDNDATAISKTDIVNATVGGLLGVHVSAADLIHLSESQTLKTVARDTLAELGVTQGVENLENAIELLYDVAGISIVEIPNSKSVSPAGTIATAAANSLRIVIEPKLPNLSKLQAGIAAGGIPLLADSDYIPTGVHLAIDLPWAQAESRGAFVESICVGVCVPTTGLGTPWIAALAMIGAAVLVRRFALSR